MSFLQHSLRNILAQPAKKLLASFELIANEYRAMVAAGRQDVDHVGTRNLSILTAKEVMPTLRNLKQLDTEDACRWVKYWGMLHVFDSSVNREGAI